MTDDYLGELNDNISRLYGLLEDYDESDFSLDSARTTAENIEDLFEEAASEIDELGGRLDMRIAQSRKKDEIIDEMADRIEDLEEEGDEGLETEYLIDEIEALLDEYVSGLDTGSNLVYAGNYKSPTFNFGVEPSPTSNANYKSPTFNFGSLPRGYSGAGDGWGGTNILPSWDDYDWEGWEDAGEPEFETPGDYAASRGVEEGEFGGSWPSVRIKYNEVPDFPGFYGSSVDSWEGGWEMPWGGRAS